MERCFSQRPVLSSCRQPEELTDGRHDTVTANWSPLSLFHSCWWWTVVLQQCACCKGRVIVQFWCHWWHWCQTQVTYKEECQQSFNRSESEALCGNKDTIDVVVQFPTCSNFLYGCLHWRMPWLYICGKPIYGYYGWMFEWLLIGKLQVIPSCKGLGHAKLWFMKMCKWICFSEGKRLEKHVLCLFIDTTVAAINRILFTVSVYCSWPHKVHNVACSMHIKGAC